MGREKNIKVSVLCLTYNQKDYIGDCLRGFISQNTDFDFEILVHDDASTDGTTEIVMEYVEKYPNIVIPFFEEENQYSKGIQISQEILAHHVRGEYVAICEGDDYWCDNLKLQNQVDFLEMNPDYSACTHDSFILNCRNNEMRVYREEKADLDVDIADIISWRNRVFLTSSVMIRSNLLKRDSTFWAKGFGDYPAALWYAINGKIRFLAKPMSVYREYANGSWTNSQEKSKRKQIETFEEINELLDRFNEYTNGQYFESVFSTKRENTISILSIKEEYKRIIKEYPEEMEKANWKGKVVLWVRAYIPVLWKVFERFL